MGRKITFRAVRFLKTVVTLLMLAVWPVASLHCKLETLPGLEFLRCEVEENGAKNCQVDGCQTIEEASFKAPDSQNFIPAPVELPDVARILRLVEDASREGLPLVFLDRIPPELPSGWLFTLRAAQPPRAPSFVS